MKHPILIRSALLPVVALLTLVGNDALAGPPRAAAVTVTRTGPQGNSATRQSSVATNGQGGYSASATLTGPKGNSASRVQSGTYDPATKTYARSGSSTGPNGQSTSFSTQLQATGNGHTRSAVRTGPNGKSASSSRTVTSNSASR